MRQTGMGPAAVAFATGADMRPLGTRIFACAAATAWTGTRCRYAVVLLCFIMPSIALTACDASTTPASTQSSPPAISPRDDPQGSTMIRAPANGQAPAGSQTQAAPAAEAEVEAEIETGAADPMQDSGPSQPAPAVGSPTPDRNAAMADRPHMDLDPPELEPGPSASGPDAAVASGPGMNMDMDMNMPGADAGLGANSELDGEPRTAEPYHGIYQDAEKWLCRPDLANNPCTAEITVTNVLADGTFEETTLAQPTTEPAADCFYTYPTMDPGLLTPPRNLDFPEIDRVAVTAIMASQATPFRSLCRVFSPIYRQASLNTYEAVPATRQRHLDHAYRDVADAFAYMLAHSAAPRPIILLSHSQGSHHMIRLVQERFEQEDGLLDRLVVAVFAGPLGGFAVPKDAVIGGSLTKVPLCTYDEQTGCALTHNSFWAGQPPGAAYASVAGALTDGQDVGCNPGFYDREPHRLSQALLPTGADQLLLTGPLSFGRRQVTTDFARLADFYTGQCTHADNGLAYLSIAADPQPDDVRDNPIDLGSPLFSDPVGLHAIDYAFIMGELLAAVEHKLAAHTTQP